MQSEISSILNKANEHYNYWKKYTIEKRLLNIEKIKNYLIENKNICANAISTDMNKPISESIAEIEKCILLCDYYLCNTNRFLTTEFVETNWEKSWFRYESLGVILGIMPWNFPFWQVFRFAIPCLLIGNVVALKHASNVPNCVKLLDEVFAATDLKIYFPILISGDQTPAIIEHKNIKAISFTGSEIVGRKVASTAGKYLKKCVLELGGSNAFIVLEDADIKTAVKTAVKARFLNSGQSCIAAKRFLIHKSVYNTFVNAFVEETKQLIIGDKFDITTQFSMMAREDLAIELENQLKKSIALGAKIILGGNRTKAYFEPTIVEQITTNMPIWQEETFGPIAPIISFENLEEAIALSNATNFGLGVSIFTENYSQIENHLAAFEEGAVFINEMVTSYPSLPFGGVKNSGYGRELSQWALYEFCNIKTIVKN